MANSFYPSMNYVKMDTYDYSALQNQNTEQTRIMNMFSSQNDYGKKKILWIYINTPIVRKRRNVHK